MRYDADKQFWCVTDPGPVSVLADICFKARLGDLDQFFPFGLTRSGATLFDTQAEATEEAQARLLARRVARNITDRLREHRGLPPDAILRVTLHDEGGTVIWRGDVT